eukprot:gene415-525_t
MIKSTIGDTLFDFDNEEIITRFTFDRTYTGTYTYEEYLTRVKLAASFQLVAYHGWDELIYNHMTARIPGTDHILLNPFGVTFDEITASNLVKIDLDGNIIDPGTTNYGINATGYVIHAAIHKARPDVVSTMHTHSVAGVAVSCYKDGLVRFHQNACILPEISYHDYEGISLDLGEQERIIEHLGQNNILIMRNHGLLTCGESIEEAYFNLHQLTKACEIQVKTLASVGGDFSKLLSIEKAIQDKNQAIQASYLPEGKGVREFRAMVRKIIASRRNFW